MSQDRELDVGRTVGRTRPAVASASVVMVRDGASGLEVFMLERHVQTDFAGGALVFPGGKVETHDRHLPRHDWSGADLGRARIELGTSTEADALGLLVAAIREAFEEAGVLWAHRSGSPIDPARLRSDAFREARARLNDRGKEWDWTSWLQREGLELRLDALSFFAWWVTPDGLHRRYDTRFFVAVPPPGQEDVPSHDQIETVASRWVRPDEALAAGRRGEVTLVYPTRKNLETLGRFGDVASLLAAANEGRLDTRRLQPTIVEVDGRKLVQHPDGGPPERG